MFEHWGLKIVLAVLDTIFKQPCLCAIDRLQDWGTRSANHPAGVLLIGLKIEDCTGSPGLNLQTTQPVCYWLAWGLHGEVPVESSIFNLQTTLPACYWLVWRLHGEVPVESSIFNLQTTLPVCYWLAWRLHGKVPVGSSIFNLQTTDTSL